MLACVASVSVGFRSKERPRNGIFGDLPARNMGREPKNEREGWGRCSRPIFRAGKTPKIPFLGLSLLPNTTETLATQAITMFEE